MKTILLLILIFTFNLFPQGLTGIKTIGSGGNYETFQAAINDLVSSGVGTGGVIFNVFPGIYPERISIASFTGSSEENRVVFQASGTAVIKGTGTSATTEAMVTLTACNYVTFDGINVEDGGTSSADQVEIGYLITGTATVGSNHIIIKNCSVTMGGGAVYGSRFTRGIIIRSAATASEGSNNNNLISNVIINKVAWGIQVAGRATLAGVPTFPDFNNEIKGCILGNNSWIGHNEPSSGIGILLSSQKYARVHNNTIDSVIIETATAPVLPVSVSGISVDNASGEIYNNKINNIKYYGPGGSSPNGIRISIIENDTMKIYNNFISNVFKSEFIPPSDNSVYSKGIWLFKQSGGGGTALIHFNTIVMEGEFPISYSSAGFYLAKTSTGTSFALLTNNIIINNIVPINFTPHQYGNSAYAIIDGNSERDYLVNDYNLLFVADSNALIGQIGRQLGTTVVNAPTFAEWQNISQGDSNSVSKEVSFVNLAAGDLHLAGSSIGDYDLAAAPVSWITFDIDNQIRDNVPYKGADEDMIPIPVELSSFAADVNDRTVELKWSTATETNSLSFQVERTTAETESWSLIADLKAAGTTTERKDYSFTDRNLNSGSYLYRLKMVDFDGTYKYSQTVEVEIGIPMEFTLSQNYPNPFNPTTKINYQVPVDASVTIELFDVTGQKVATLVSQDLKAGYHTVEVSGLRLASGMYIYRMTAVSVESGKNFMDVKKMMMLK
jgi:hypothetical protein